jgi:hypothetical protein
MTLNDDARKKAAKILADKYVLPDGSSPTAPGAAEKIVQLRQAEPMSQEEVEDEMKRLAALPNPSLEYDDGVERLKARSGYKKSTLEALIEEKREREFPALGSPAAYSPDRPLATEPVDGAALINDLFADLRKYVVVNPDQAVMAAFWVIHTYLLEQSYIAPRLAIVAPDMRCGKSIFIEWLNTVVQRPKKAENVTGPAVYRAIEDSHPTFLIDEFDTFLPKDDALRGILNSGHRKGGQAVRVAGAFSTFSAVAIAGIGSLPMTLHDRSLCVHLQRRRRDEEVEELRLDRIDDTLARRCARWAKDNESAFASADPEMPHEIFNRVGDNWRPLLAIADLAGGEWPDQLRYIAVKLALTEEGENPSEGERLLHDIREVMEGYEWITPSELVRELRNLECFITEKGLANKLAPYGIKSIKQRWPDSGMIVQRRYLEKDFADAFSRYLPVPDVPLVPAPAEPVVKAPVRVEPSGTSGTTIKTLLRRRRLS